LTKLHYYYDASVASHSCTASNQFSKQIEAILIFNF